MRFFLVDNRDKSEPYVKALTVRGHVRVDRLDDAQAMFYGFEKAVVRAMIERAQGMGIPLFVLPHSCECEIQWDGLHEPAEVKANFVISEGQKEIMTRYGYPYPIKVTGYPFGKVRAKKVMRTVNDVLFAPKHPNPGSRKNLLFRKSDMEVNAEAFNVLLKYCRKHHIPLTVRYGGRLEGNGLWVEKDVQYERARYLIDDSFRSIRRHQVIVGMGTFAHLAVAEGRAVIMFDQDVHPHSLTEDVANWEKYKEYRAFPLGLFRGDISETMIRALCVDPDVENWKERFIGEPMDADRFVDQVEWSMG